jgi:hypothetical protein
MTARKTAGRSPAVLLTAALLALALCLPAWGQTEAPDPGQDERESLDSNAIATLSVGLVIQSLGYVGIYADLLSKGVYDPELVTKMLGETVQYMTNARNVLHQYQSRSVEVRSGDRRYLGEIENILNLLIQEAESLSAFARTRSEDDLQKYRESREKAIKLIDKLTKP